MRTVLHRNIISVLQRRISVTYLISYFKSSATMEKFTNISTTTSPLEQFDLKTLTSITHVVTILISVVVTISYLIVIILIIVDSSLHTTSDYFVASISVSQLLFASVFLPIFIDIMVLLRPHTYLLMSAFWSILLFVQSAFFLNLLVVAADIYIKISKPYEYLRIMNNCKCAIILAVVWIVSLVSGLLILLVLLVQNQNSYSETLTFVAFIGKHANIVYAFVDGFVAPSIIFLSCVEIGLTRIMIKQRREIQATSMTRGPNSAVKRNFERVKILGSLVLFASFLICWIPLLCVWNVLFILKIDLSSLKVIIILMCFSIVIINQTAFGVLVFMFRQAKYKNAFKQALKTLREKMLRSSGMGF